MLARAKATVVKTWGSAQSASGFTVTELLVVIGVGSILLAIATLYFPFMVTKYQIESQVKRMQADFNSVQVAAATTKTRHAILLSPNSYAFLSYSSYSDLSGTQYSTTQIRYPIQRFSAGSYSAFTSPVLYDTSGCMSSPVPPLYVAIGTGVNGLAMNALALQAVQMNIGLIQGTTIVQQ